MNPCRLTLIGFVLFVLMSCVDESNPDFQSLITELNLASVQGGEPNLFLSNENEVYISWVEYVNDSTDALLFSSFTIDRWSDPKKISEGSDWFVNWADFPSLVVSNNSEYLAAHWLQKSAEGVYDYDVKISQSLDEGQNWSTPFTAHNDGVAAEHGFVSMVPFKEDKIFATWLDGRNTKPSESHEDGHGHSGSMTLRCAVFDKAGQLSEEYELDPKVCECCQTSAAITEEGPMVVYRDRSDNEIRDISAVKHRNGKWSDPYPVFKDNWEIAGCPVNGPAMDSYGNGVAVTWFTMEEDSTFVKIAFSQDHGSNFDSPIRVDVGNAIGRVDLIMISNEKALVSWMESRKDKANINLRFINQDGTKSEVFSVSQTNNSRSSGFPRMVLLKDNLIMAWTEMDSLSSVKTVKVDLTPYLD